MKDFLNIGSSPCDEDCAQVGSEDYRNRARKECQRFIATIHRVCGQEPVETRLAIKEFPHDFGSYLEVVCYFDDALPESMEYAFWVEGNTPLTWDEGVNQRKWIFSEGGEIR